MDFIDTIQLSFSRYFDINNRATRTEFWAFFTFYIIGISTSVFIDILAGSFFSIKSPIFYRVNIGIFSGVFIFLTTIPYLTVSMRRLNDAGLSKLFILLLIVPFGNVALLFLWAKKSKADNKNLDLNEISLDK